MHLETERQKYPLQLKWWFFCQPTDSESEQGQEGTWGMYQSGLKVGLVILALEGAAGSQMSI